MTDQVNDQMAGDGQVNPKKLFVGNLPFNTTQQELEELFAQYGELVEVKLITDRMSGRSKGIAFVEFAEEDQAAQAMEALNNSELAGRTIFVSVARPFVPREKRSFSNDGGGRRGGFDRGSRGGFRRGGNDRGGRDY